MAVTSATTDRRSPPPFAVDRRSGFCCATKTFHSLRPPVPVPLPSGPESRPPLSFAHYAFSLLPSPLPTNPALIDATTGDTVSYPQFLTRVHTLASSLQTQLGLSKGHVAFVLSPARLDVPVLYFALLSFGAVVCPANPASTPAELARQVSLVNPSVAFATSATASKLPRHVTQVLLDSPQFRSLLLLLTNPLPPIPSPTPPAAVDVLPSDVAVIQFSSGTTGLVKAAALPHRSFVSMTAGFHALRRSAVGEVTLLLAPMFHSLGFFFALKGVALGETVVVMDRVGIREMLQAAERHRVTLMTASPPLVVAMGRSEEAVGLDLGSLWRVFCGGAPLPEEAAKRFIARFPGVELCQGYGSTEAGGISIMIGPEECCHLRSVGRLSTNIEAKIVDNVTGEALSIGQQGEIWVRGPSIMIGYIGDHEANASTFSSDGWLKTGDLCYFDHDGFLFIVDRLKELIKYKAYQVPPVELEHLLLALPEIIDAAVIPYPDEETGQIPMAFVVKQPGSNISEAQVMDFVAKQVAPYKKIRKVAFIKSIPKSPAGKILRRKLTTHALCGFASRM